jgi:FkbM family methyltransferase
MYHPPPHNEPHLLELLPARGGVALDVGANVGAWSYELLKRFDSVQAVEPQLECFGSLAELRAEYPGRFTIHRFAAWLNRGEVLLQVREHNGMTNVCGMEEVPGRGPVVTTYGIACQPLDFLQIPVDFVKIDTEGAEIEVLKGLQATLRSRRPGLLVEYHAAENRDWCLAWLAKIGYVMRDIPINDSLGWLHANRPN